MWEWALLVKQDHQSQGLKLTMMDRWSRRLVELLRELAVGSHRAVCCIFWLGLGVSTFDGSEAAWYSTALERVVGVVILVRGFYS